MGHAGRKPLTNAEKHLRIDRGGKAFCLSFGEDEPQRPTGMSAIADEEWDRVVPGLFRNGVISAADSSMLGAYCESVANVRRAEAKLSEALPLLGVAHAKAVNDVHARAVKTMICLAEQFGLSPLSRQRVVVGSLAETEEDDPDGVLPPPI